LFLCIGVGPPPGAPFQLQAAKAAQLSAKLAMDAEIGGVNTTVCPIRVPGEPNPNQ
jgi:hypothetical protein